MATDLRDDAFELDAFLLADLPFKAYFPVETVPSVPIIQSPSAGVAWLLIPPKGARILYPGEQEDRPTSDDAERLRRLLEDEEELLLLGVL
jgi:hypothetical protein